MRAVGRLGAMRARAESRMDSRATIRRMTGHMVQDETSGREVPEWTTTHTDLPVRVATDRGGSATRTVTTPGGEMQVAARTLHVPASTADLADGDYADITSGELAGTAWRIVEATMGDQQTARRMPVLEVARPAEWV